MDQAKQPATAGRAPSRTTSPSAGQASKPSGGAARAPQAELKQAVRAQDYQAGRATLAPQKSPGSGSGLGVLGTFIDGLKAKATQARGAMEGEAGQFVEAELGLDIDIPNIPGLKVSLYGEVWYERYHSGEQFLHVRSLTGVKYGLGHIFNVNASIMQRLELTGHDLGRALMDAVKQCTYVMLSRAGVHEQFRDLERLAQEGPSVWEVCSTLIPVYGTYKAAKMALARAGAPNIHRAYLAFMEFFKNDQAVTFDASIGLQGGGGFEAKGVEGGIQLGAALGIGDTTDGTTRTFGEISGEGRVERDNSYAMIRVVKRWMQGGETSLKVELWGAYSTSRGIDPRQHGLTILARVFGGPLFSKAMGQLSATGQGGGKLTALSELANVFIGLAAAGGLKGKAAEAMSGVEVNLHQKNGHWEEVDARIKKMTGSSFEAGGANVGLKAGGFWEASADVKKMLGAGEEAPAQGHGKPKAHAGAAR